MLSALYFMQVYIVISMLSKETELVEKNGYVQVVCCGLRVALSRARKLKVDTDRGPHITAIRGRG